MTDSYAESSTVALDTIRKVLSIFDYPVYIILGFTYQLFFNVASADIFSGGTIMRFYGRVQVIIGVFMMFQLAMTLLRGVIEPDSFSKDKGGGSLLKRVATSLILITLLMPINTGGGNEYQKQLNNNGLLFGTLYSLQHRILSNNTIGRLVLGTGEGETTYMTDDADEQLAQSARIFTSSVLKGFYRINLVPEDQRTDTGDKDPATLNTNRMCQDMDEEVREAYVRLDAEPTEIISMVNETCSTELISYHFLFHGNKKYVFTYLPVVSTVVGIVFTVILLSFTFDVAIRAFKLAFLRLLAPIPLIKYMDPKGSGDEAFKAWSKTLISTYLDLFVRLIVVYFVIFMIQTMITKGISMNSAGNGFVRVMTFIIIWIGLFMFAKQAPKFIRQILGLKDSQFSLFSGFGEFGAAMGLAAAVPGAIGSGIASARASRLADETRESFGETDIFGRKVRPDSFFNRGKHLAAGIFGGISGGVAGGRAAVTAKDHGFNASVEAMRKRNADVLNRGNDGSTLLGRIGSTASNVFVGEGRANATEREINTNKGRIEALKAVKSRVTGEMVKKDWTHGNLGIATDNAGNAIGEVNFKAFEANLAAGRSRGDGLVHFKDVSGASHTISIDDAERQRGFLLKNNEDNYIVQHVAGTVAASDVDNRLMTLIHNAEVLGGSSDFVRNADGTITRGSNKHITNRSSVNDAIDGFEDYNTQLTRQNAINKANDQFSGQKK